MSHDLAYLSKGDPGQHLHEFFSKLSLEAHGATQQTPVAYLLCIDEYQKVDGIDGGCVIVSALYTLFHALVLRSDPRLYVLCPVFVGLYLQPLLDVTKASCMTLVQTPLPCLTAADSEAVMDALVAGNWRKHPVIRRALFQFRAVPKCVVEGIVPVVNSASYDAVSLRDGAIKHLKGIPDGEIRSYLRLIACSVWGSGALVSADGAIGRTAAQWEMHGGISVDAAVGAPVIVLPYAMLVAVALSATSAAGGCTPAELRLAECIRHLVDVVDPSLFVIEGWRALELFGGLYLAVRINSKIVVDISSSGHAVDPEVTVRAEELSYCEARSFPPRQRVC